jgi:hypothetical protein
MGISTFLESAAAAQKLPPATAAKAIRHPARHKLLNLLIIKGFSPSRAAVFSFA